MEILILIILLLVLYIVVDLKFLFVPAIKRMAGYSTKSLNGEILSNGFFHLSNIDGSTIPIKP
jgi:hypothetical protein